MHAGTCDAAKEAMDVTGAARVGRAVGQEEDATRVLATAAAGALGWVVGSPVMRIAAKFAVKKATINSAAKLEKTLSTAPAPLRGANSSVLEVKPATAWARAKNQNERSKKSLKRGKFKMETCKRNRKRKRMQTQPQAEARTKDTLVVTECSVLRSRCSATTSRSLCEPSTSHIAAPTHTSDAASTSHAEGENTYVLRHSGCEKG